MKIYIAVTQKEQYMQLTIYFFQLSKQQGVFSMKFSDYNTKLFLEHK